MVNIPVSFHLLSGLLRIWDVATILVGAAIAARLVLPGFEDIGLRDWISLELQLRHSLLLALTIFSWAVLYQACGLYGHRAVVASRDSISAVLTSNTIGVAALAALLLLLDTPVPVLTFGAILWAAATVLAIAPRALAAFLLNRLAGASKNRRSFLLVGTNSRAQRIAQSLSRDPIQLREFIGYVDNRADLPASNGNDSGPEIFLCLSELPEYLRHSPVDDVILCLPLQSYYSETTEIIARCEEQGITVHVCADFFETRMTHSRIRYFADQSLITVASNEMYGAPALVKRSIDLAVSSLLLVLLSPLFAAAALAVAVSSPGPVFFAQERVGINRKNFRVFKFRTMVTDAELQQGALESINESSGPTFKIQKDPRITPVGRFLRKFSIDELPQLLNVIRGEMSLVGPRPLPLRDYSGFEKDWHRRRLSVPPGITGLWQVTDRKHQSFENWMKLDMQYIDQWSVWLDLKIIALTIPAVLRGSGH